MSKISSNLLNVTNRINQAAEKRPKFLNYFQPRLVAVSKYKATSDIIEAYKAGQRNFGENYVIFFLQTAFYFCNVLIIAK